MAPWLIAAVVVPTGVVLGLKMRPSDEWSEQVIRDWADSEGLQIAEIEEVRWFGGLYLSNHSRLYRVRVLENNGFERECKAVVGRLLLGRTARNIAITWVKAS
jgi:hypothetical protein